MVTRVMAAAYAVTLLMFILYPLNKKNLEKLHQELMEQRANTDSELEIRN